MKRAVLSIVGATIIVGAIGAVAVAQETAVVNVPFQFTVNHKSLPAGKYEITVSGDPSVITVTPAKGVAVVSPTVTRLAQRGAPLSEAELVFDKLGDQYLLSELWLPASDGYLVTDTKQPHQHHTIKVAKKTS